MDKIYLKIKFTRNCDFFLPFTNNELNNLYEIKNIETDDKTGMGFFGDYRNE